MKGSQRSRQFSGRAAGVAFVPFHANCSHEFLCLTFKLLHLLHDGPQLIGSLRIEDRLATISDLENIAHGAYLSYSLLLLFEHPSL